MFGFLHVGRHVAAQFGLAAAMTIFTALQAVPAGAQSAARTVTVEAVTLKRTPLVETVSSVGNLVAGESVVIRPEIEGRIVEIGFEEGQPVKSGQLLFRLDAAVYQAQLREAEARLGLNRRTFERARTLRQKGASSAEILDRASSELRVAEASVELAKARLDKMRIVAPFAGTAGLRQVSLGAFVEAKTELVTLVDLDSLKVEFRLPERYHRVIVEDATIRAEPDALPGESFEGRIFAIDPVIDINGRSIALKAKLSNPARRLRPGMFVRVTLRVDGRNDAIVAPESAIVQRGDGQFVYRIKDGEAVLTKVRLGLRQTGRIEIVEGLAEGDTVVTAGQIKLRPGVKVKVADYSADGPEKR